MTLKSLPNCRRSQSATTRDSYAPISTQYYSLLQSATPVLFCTTKYYPVLQSTTPVLFGTTKGTILPTTNIRYYKVLLQYCSSTTLQYYSVLQSTTKSTPVLLCTPPVLLCTTKHCQYYSVLQSSKGDRRTGKCVRGLAPVSQVQCLEAIISPLS